MKLKDIPQGNIFKVPDDYFESFPERVGKRISERDLESREVVPISKNIIWYSVAASILLIMVFGLYQWQSRTETAEEMLAGIPSADLIAYLEESDFSTEELLHDIDYTVISTDLEGLPDPGDIIPEDLDETTIDQLINEFGLELPLL